MQRYPRLATLCGVTGVISAGSAEGRFSSQAENDAADVSTGFRRAAEAGGQANVAIRGCGRLNRSRRRDEVRTNHREARCIDEVWARGRSTKANKVLGGGCECLRIRG